MIAQDLARTGLLPFAEEKEGEGEVEGDTIAFRRNPSF